LYPILKILINSYKELYPILKILKILINSYKELYPILKILKILKILINSYKELYPILNYLFHLFLKEASNNYRVHRVMNIILILVFQIVP
jgi:hypothetical protein